MKIKNGMWKKNAKGRTNKNNDGDRRRYRNMCVCACDVGTKKTNLLFSTGELKNQS